MSHQILDKVAILRQLGVSDELLRELQRLQEFDVDTFTIKDPMEALASQLLTDSADLQLTLPQPPLVSDLVLQGVR